MGKPGANEEAAYEHQLYPILILGSMRRRRRMRNGCSPCFTIALLTRTIREKMCAHVLGFKSQVLHNVGVSENWGYLILGP